MTWSQRSGLQKEAGPRWTLFKTPLSLVLIHKNLRKGVRLVPHNFNPSTQVAEAERSHRIPSQYGLQIQF